MANSLRDKPLLVALTGAGISAESGIATFRDAGGLWEGYPVEQVATPEGWASNSPLVLDFYNQRRKKALEVKPNRGHEILAELEKDFRVIVVTQNVDNLHERAGSSNVIHLHGSLFESRSTRNEKLIYPITGWELKPGDLCELGSQLRPNIVWFGEAVPLMEMATQWASQSSVFLVIGTSMAVYPAAGLLSFVSDKARKFIIDPKIPNVPRMPNLHFIQEKASMGMVILQKMIAEDAV